MTLLVQPTRENNDVYKAQKTIALDGTAGNGAQGTVNVFTVTGTVMARVINVCTEDLVSAGGGTIAQGITGNTATFIAATTATDIDNAEAWVDNAPTTGELLAQQNKVLHNTTIIYTVATADITDGTLQAYCLWRPISAGATVVAA